MILPIAVVVVGFAAIAASAQVGARVAQSLVNLLARAGVAFGAVPHVVFLVVIFNDFVLPATNT
jgi:hypothetical protein